MTKIQKTYPIDGSAILYLSQMEPNHSNVYRFSARMTEPVCPEALQKAAQRVFSRFPTIFARYKSGFFDYRMVPLAEPPQVCEDPGLLKTMSKGELCRSAYRIFYQGNEISIEAFHGLTDGYGAIASLRTLLAEYLYLRKGLESPERVQMLHSGEPDWEEELRDAYSDYADGKPVRPANRQSYQLKPADRDWHVKHCCQRFSTQELLAASRRHGVSMTVLLSTLMAETIMEMQSRENTSGKKRPVRIMVPIDLRRLFPSRTLRNFILYALPTLEWEERNLPRQERLARFQQQLKTQTAREPLAEQITANVRAQESWWYRMIPRSIKCTAMKIAYRFFGERNSSITLTNLGPFALSDALKPHVLQTEVHLTPRRGSPYNCAILSCGDCTSISISRFSAEPELEMLFFGKLRSLLNA